MSLIGDALRRKEEDGGRKAATPPPLPPPLPITEHADSSAKPVSSLTLRGRAPAKQEPEETPTYQKSPGLVTPPVRRKKPRAWLELLLVILFILLLLVGGVWAYLAFFENPAVAPPMATTVQDEEPALAPPGPPPSELVKPTTEAVLVKTSPEPVLAPPTHTEPVATVAEPAAPPPPPVKSTPPDATPTATSATQAPSSPPQIPIIWPSFSLQAAMGSGTSGSVMINGEIVQVGSSYADITIIKITPKGVIMEYEGEQRVFRVRR